MASENKWRNLSVGFALFAIVAMGGCSHPPKGLFQSEIPVARSDRYPFLLARQRELADELADKDFAHNVKWVFLGDSITNMWLQNAEGGSSGGGQIWRANFGVGGSGPLSLNLGVSGDRTEHLLHRITPVAKGGEGQLEGLAPDKIFILIGINNIVWPGEPPSVDSVFRGIVRVVETASEQCPDATIVVTSILPVQPNGDDTRLTVAQNYLIEDINRKLEHFASRKNKNLKYFDLRDHFIDSYNNMDKKYTIDGLHLNEDGYKIWQEALSKEFQR